MVIRSSCNPALVWHDELDGAAESEVERLLERDVEEAELLELLDDVSPEYAAAATRYFGEEQGQAWIAQLRGQPMACVAIRPNWVGILDFQSRFPSALRL
jgi:anti-sigma factor RsiW